MGHSCLIARIDGIRFIFKFILNEIKNYGGPKNLLTKNSDKTLSYQIAEKKIFMICSNDFISLTFSNCSGQNCSNFYLLKK